MMEYDIVWTKKARDDYFEIIDFLLQEWNEKVAGNFRIKVENYLSLISGMPRLCPETKEVKKLRRCVISKQVSMYYFSDKNKKEIQILRFYDNRKEKIIL